MSMLVKICGLRDADTVAAAVAAGADAIGFVFVESPRRVSVEEACRACDALPDHHTAGCRHAAPVWRSLGRGA